MYKCCLRLADARSDDGDTVIGCQQVDSSEIIVGAVDSTLHADHCAVGIDILLATGDLS